MASSAIASGAAEGDICCMTGIDMSDDGAAAITGRDSGANARPAIIKTASNWRMAEAIFTVSKFSQTCGKG
jgi:hypothetical protein